MVKIHSCIRCPNCGFNDFELLGGDDMDDELRCTQCNNTYTRLALGANVIDLGAERRKRESQDTSRQG